MRERYKEREREREGEREGGRERGREGEFPTFSLNEIAKRIHYQ
jgi:hypothetical protein